PGSDIRTYTIRVDKQKIYSAPVWESSRIEEYSRPEWVGNIYSYYGVQPGVGINIRTNVGVRGEERREREQTNVERRATQSAPTPNADVRMRPPRNPRERAERAGATPATAPEAAGSPREGAAETASPGERHRA